MTPRPTPVLLALLALVPAPLTAGEGRIGAFVAATAQRFLNLNESVYTLDVTTLPPKVHGPFFEETFDHGFNLILLRDAPIGIVHGGGPRLHRIDFGDPEAPVVAATATLPFRVNDLTRLADARNELVAVGDGGELAVIDPWTLGILASFTLPTERVRVRTSRDGRLLLTLDTALQPRMSFLASFDPFLGPGPETPMRNGGANFNEAVFSPDSRTAVLISTSCLQLLVGPPFCTSLLNVYDTSSPAKPAFREEIDPYFDAVRSSVLDRAGGRVIFHRRGNQEWVTPHQLLPFTLAGAGILIPEPIVGLTARGDFEASGLVRTAGAKRLLVFTSSTDVATPVARLHDLDPALTSAGTSYLLPLPLEPQAVFHLRAAVFADGFESGDTGAWGPADF